MQLSYADARRIAIDILKANGHKVGGSCTPMKLALKICNAYGGHDGWSPPSGYLNKRWARSVVRSFASKRAGEHRVLVFEANKAKNKLFEQTDAFLRSREWKAVRYQALKMHGGRCQCCGASPEDGTKLNVDHIMPRSKYPQLALDMNNLQVLCAECNAGKSNIDETDWRPQLKAVK